MDLALKGFGVDAVRLLMPKATTVFGADDSRLGAVLARVNGRMLALQSRVAKIAGAFLAIRRLPPRHIGRVVETVVGCKWSLTVVELVKRGIRRPGAMERAVEGLTAKVLNDCLRLLVSYGVLEKRSFPEVPPRVECHFTSFGKRFVETFKILDSLEAHLDRAKKRAATKAEPPSK